MLDYSVQRACDAPRRLTNTDNDCRAPLFADRAETGDPALIEDHSEESRHSSNIWYAVCFQTAVELPNESSGSDNVSSDRLP